MSRLRLVLSHPPILPILAAVAAGAWIVAADRRWWLRPPAVAGVAGLVAARARFAGRCVRSDEAVARAARVQEG